MLKEAGSGFLYKMLRKKNITLNGKKADGTEKLKEGDVVKLFLSDETFQKFSGETILATEFLIPEAKREFELSILYEDDDILIINKPKGMLSQKSSPSDFSANEYILDYLLRTNQVAAEELKTRIGTQGEGVFFGTIHGLANQILRRNNIDTSKLLEEENFDEAIKRADDLLYYGKEHGRDQIVTEDDVNPDEF